MANVNITLTAPLWIAGTRYAAASTVDVPEADAELYVSRGQATFTTPPTPRPGDHNVHYKTHTVVAGGTHVWAGGDATTDSITVTGLAATDVVQATIVARASTETLVMAAKDVANGQIDLTLSANGTDDTTQVDYLVLRPV